MNQENKNEWWEHISNPKPPKSRHVTDFVTLVVGSLIVISFIAFMIITLV